jgi:hypothetical protein
VSNKGPNATTDSGVSSSRSGTGPDGIADPEVSSLWSGRGPDGPADTEISKSPFAQGSNEDVMTVDEERVFMHRPDARCSVPDFKP